MRYIYKVMLFILFLIIPFTIYADDVCTKYELARSNSIDNYEKMECFDTYIDAKNKMYSLVNTPEDNYDNLVILEINNGKKTLIDAKYALVSLNKGSDKLTYLYSKSNGTGSSVYMNNYSSYGGVDAVLVDYDNTYKSVKVKISGVTGWVKNNEYKLIPITWVVQSSFYKIDSNISHYYTKDILGNSTQSYRVIGPKEEYLEEGKYYSYDGIYFYKDYVSMINDYRNNSHELSINKDNPYYNYYLYLPHRSKTNYEMDDVDSYIRNVLNFKGSLYGKFLTNNYSTIYGTAEYFFNSEKLYGANAISVFSLSRNESANGRSSIAYNKNNIFGHNAVDGAAYSSSSGYLDVRSSIYTHGYGYINYGYAEVADSRYYGSHFGNKYRGMNVMYASDVYWGEKAASYYYSFDKDNGMEDYNYYQLIISKTKDINARSKPNTNSSIVYTIKYQDLPFILLEEVEGTMVNGSNIWYKIQSDSNIDSNSNIIKSNSNSWPNYNWDGAVYVHSSYFTKINNVKSENGVYNSPSSIRKYKNTVNTFASSSKYSPKVGRVLDNIDYFYTSSLLERKGTIQKNSYVIILEEVKNENDTNYLVITDYGTYQKHWVSSNNIEIINKDMVSVNISEANKYISVVDKNNKELKKIYSGSFLPIIGTELINDKLYLKVEYNNNTIQNGYIDSNINNISYTLNNLNNNNTNNFDDIKDKVREFLKKKSDNSLFMYNSLSHIKDNIFNFSGFMGIKKMDNKNVSNYLAFYNEVTEDIYIYNLNKWEKYPYSMKSLDDDKDYYYDDGWFNSNIDLSDLPQGDYKLVVIVKNNNNYSGAYFTNIAYMDMTRRCSSSDKGYLIEVDYSTNGSPLLFSVRNSLISLDIPKTMDPMYNFFNSISIDNNNLIIKGTSHNFGIGLGTKDDVKRSIIFENQDSFIKYEMDLGYITNGDYPITMAVSDNLDKTKAWFNKSIDISSIPKGRYTIYIKNTVNNITYYGELIDVGYTDFSKINSDKYNLLRNDNIRLRMELIIK